jgi:O-antigen/teichoic acid export membrane protein
MGLIHKLRSFSKRVGKPTSLSTFAGLVFIILGNISNFFTPIVIARNYVPSDFGTFSAFWGIVGMMGMIYLGIQTTVAGNLKISKPNTNFKLHIDSYTTFVLATSLASLIVLSVFELFYPVNILGDPNSLFLIGISIFSTSLTALSFGKLIASNSLIKFYCIGFFFSFAKILIILLSSYFNLTINSTLKLLISQQLLLSLMTFLYTNSLGHMEFKFLQKLSIFPYIFSSLLWVMILSDVLLIRFHLDETDSGLFSMGSSLVKIVLVPIVLITNYSLANYSRMPAVLNLRSNSLKFLLYLTTLIIGSSFIVFLTFGNTVFEILYGVEYISPPKMLALMLLALAPYIYLLLLSTVILNKLDIRDIVMVIFTFLVELVLMVSLELSVYSFLLLQAFTGLFLLVFFEFRKRSI